MIDNAPEIKPTVGDTFTRNGAHWTVRSIAGRQIVGRLSHLDRDPVDASEIICLSVDDFFNGSCRLQLSLFD